MPLAELSLSLRLETSSTVVFVLDASESCRSEQGQIVSLLQDVLARLPAELNRSIYFLGNPQPYPCEEFEENASRWFEENYERGSVIGPVMESLADGDYDRIVLVGSGPVYDLEDWLDTELAAKTLLVSVGEPLYENDDGLARCHADPGQVAGGLHDPPTEARISGHGFMPFWWSNPAYDLQLEDGEAALAAHGVDDYGIQLRCFAEHGSDMQCSVTHASGKRVERPLEEVILPEPDTPRGAVLETKEAAAFRRAAQKEDYVCPVCGSSHTWQTLQCAEDGGYSILGTPIYRTLTDNNMVGLVVFAPKGDGNVYCHRNESPVLRISPGSIVLQRRAEVSLWVWADDCRSWRCAETSLEMYHQLGDGSYVVVLR